MRGKDAEFILEGFYQATVNSVLTQLIMTERCDCQYFSGCKNSSRNHGPNLIALI